MAITRLKRKGRKNKLKSAQRTQKLKLESFKPVIKKVDVEAIKAEFKSLPVKEDKEVSKKEAVAVDAASEVKEAPAKKKAAPKAKAKDETEAKEVKKKAPAKKAAAKTTKAKKEE